MSDYIKHDCNKAEIRVHIHNGGEDSYRHEVYGDTIIFERTIHKAGQSVQKVLSERKKVVCVNSRLLHGEFADPITANVSLHFRGSLGGEEACAGQL